MKKLLSYLVAVAIALGVIVCGAGGLASTASAQDKAPTKDELLALIKTPKGEPITLDQYKTVFLNYAKIEIDKNDEITWGNPVSQALDQIAKDYKVPDTKEFLFSYLSDKTPQIRGMAIKRLDPLRNEDDVIAKIVEVIPNETNGFVIKAILNTIGHHFEKNEALAKFMLAQTDSDNANVRSTAASRLIQNRNKNSEAVKEVAHKLINDKEESVRRIVLGAVGDLEDESFIDDLEKVITDPNQQPLHYHAFKSLFNLWYDTDCTSKRAHDICFKYMSQKPRSRNIPEWLSVSSMYLTNPNDYGYARKEWKKKATYYSESEWVKVLADIASDTNAFSFARFNAVERLAKLGTKEDLEALKKTIEALPETDEAKGEVINRIDKQLEKMDK